MRQETKVITYYQFSELSEQAKHKAVENLYDINVSFDWWENVYEDAKMVGIKITEFEIDRGAYCNGELMESMTDVCHKIIEGHGENCETHKTAKDFLRQWDELVAKYSDGINAQKVAEDNEGEFDDAADELEKEFKKSILEDYRIILQEEYEYQTSEEAIIETIEANEYEFDEDGNLL
jgi:hypothetical protein